MTTPKIDRERRYTRLEVSQILNVSTSTVRRLVLRGMLIEETHLSSHRIFGRDLARYMKRVRLLAREDPGPAYASMYLDLTRFRKEKIG